MSYMNVQDYRLPFFLRYLSDLVAYRHLFFNLIASDLRTRFRRTRLGILWAIIQPLGFALVIAAVWGALQRSATYLEFALYLFSGLVVFDKFSLTVIGGQDALASGAGYLKQARIPFLIFQLRVVFTSTVMLVFALVGLFIFAAATNQFPVVGSQLLLVPVFIPIYIMFLTPIAIIMSIWGQWFRDLKHISGLSVQATFLLSPVILPRELLSEPRLSFMEYVNPMVPLLDLFRDPILHSRLWEAKDLIVVGCWIAGLWTLAILTATSAGRKIVFAL